MRSSRLACAGVILGIALHSHPAAAQKKYRVKVDSSPQQAAVYVESKAAGIQGYTPAELRLARGDYKLIVELPGYKPLETTISVKARAKQEWKYVLERAPRPATLDLRASDDSAHGASVSVDGKPSGQVPTTVEVPAGRHEVVVTREGYGPYREWVDAGDAERRTMVIVLSKKTPEAGALVVSADVDGAEVWVDGQRKDVAPTVIQGLPAGSHVVEVKKEGMPPWRQEVNVVAGSQVKVTATIAASAGGTLRVLSSTSGAEVYLDGDLKGQVPQNIRGVRPGSHLVELRKKGFAPVTQEVRINAGEERAVKLDLGAAQRETATLKVASAVPDAEVFIDGGSAGRAPIERQIEPGHHIIVVQKSGFAEYKRELDLAAGQVTALTADLRSAGGVKVIATPAGAQVVLDGVLIGPTPATLPEVQAGEHVLEIKAAGYFDYRQTIKIEGGKHQVLTADLKQVPTGPTGAALLAEIRGQTSVGGRAVRRQSFTADVGVGYPYFIDARLTAGAWSQGMVAIDGGVEIRTFFQITDIAAQGKIQFVAADPLYMAFHADFGGGGGPNGRNTFFTDLGLALTLSFDNMVSFSAKTWLNAFTDRFCPSLDDMQTVPRMECMQPYVRPDGTTYDPRKDRDNDVRWYLGAWLDVSLLQHISLFLSLYGVPFQHQRLMFRGLYNDIFPDDDQKVYGQIGLTVKY